MDEKAKVLDIAMNLTRMGNWAADGYRQREKRIKLFLENTDGYIKSLDPSKFSRKFKVTFERFMKDYNRLKKEKPEDPLYWGEQMMTWGNILTHRARLI